MLLLISIKPTMDQDSLPIQPLLPDNDEAELEAVAPITRIGVESELSKYPIHNLAKHGRVDIQITKRRSDGQIDLKWEVSYSERYGQARQLAYKLDTIIVNQRLDEAGRPLPRFIKMGSLAEICRSLGMAESGRNKTILKNGLLQNASAFITAKLKYRTNDGGEETLEAGFTRYNVVFTGEKLPDGNVADAVYLILNEPYRGVLNKAPIRPLNYDYLKALKPSPQRFYEIISSRVYAALKNRNPFARILYSEFCTYSALTRHFDYENFRVQMAKIHQPHLKSGYIAKAHYEEAADQEGKTDWMMCYQPGPRARAEYMTFARKSKQLEATRAMEAEEELQGEVGEKAERSVLIPVSRKRAAPKDPLIAEMTNRGISQNRAQKILADLQQAQRVQDQLEWGDFLVQSQPGKIKSPAGFYVYLLTENVLPPPTFETSRQRKQREEAQSAAEQERLKVMQLEDEYKAYQSNHVEEFIRKQVSESELAAITERKRKHLAETFKSFRMMPAETVRSMLWGAVKAEIRPRMKFLTFEEFVQQKENQPSLFETAAPTEQGSGPTEPPPSVAIGTPKPARKLAIAPPVDISAPPAAKPPYRANLSVTEAAPKIGSGSAVQPEQGSEPSLGVDEVILQERYREFCRKEAQRALDHLEILERGRRMKAARTFLLTEHPNREHHQRLIAEEEYEEFHKLSEDHLLRVTQDQLKLPEFEDWKRYALSAISSK